MTPTLDAPNDGIDAVQEHPEQIPDDEPESPYGPRNEKLPQQLIDALKCRMKEIASEEMYVRRREVMRDRRNRFYERGFQHIYESKQGNFTQGSPGQLVSVEGRDIQCPNYIDDYNIFTRYLDINCSILTQNTPGIDFRPINPNLTEDAEAAETAEGYRQMFDRSNNPKSIQAQIARFMGLSGRVVVWTRSEANAQKFGYNENGTAKKMETATVYGTLESRVPILAKSQEDALYLILYDDPDVKQAKAEYPEFADKIKANTPGLSENAYERTARLGVLQGVKSQATIGDAFSHLTTREHAWMRPANFEGEVYNDPFDDAEAGDIDEDGAPLSVKGKLDQLFPLGAHVVFVGGEYVGCWAESMDDASVIGFPREGEGMFRVAYMDPMVVVQDRFNDNMNAAAEVWDMGWPSTWVNCEDQEYDSIVEQKADPYAIRQKKVSTGRKTADDFFREPNPDLPATFMQFTEHLEGELAQFILAAPPSLFGAGMQDQQTASGYAQARAQAMGQQGMVFATIQYMMARMYYQAALCASRNPDHSEEIVIPTAGGQSTTLRLEKLTKGKFGAYPDEDSGFPESIAQKRGTLERIWQMASTDPSVGQQITQSPDNWKMFSTYYGFPELVIPEAQSRDKQQFEIEQLLQGAPIPPDPQIIEQAQIAHAAAALQAQTQGQPAPPFDIDALTKSLTESSISVQELDYHPWEFEKCKEWLSSEARRRANAEAMSDPDEGVMLDENGDCPGVQNVILHAMQHKKYMDQMMAQAQMAQMAMTATGRPPSNPVKKAPAQLAAPAAAQPSAPAPMGATQ